MSQTYSFSKLDQFQNCPRQYKFEHIEKAAVEKPIGVELYLGSAVHHALEKLYNLKGGGKVIPLEELLGIYNKFWEGPDKSQIKVTRESMAVEDYIKSGEESLTRYYHKYQPFDEGDILGLEMMVRFPLDPEGKFSMVGKVDKVVKRPDGVLEIVDYKTSPRPIAQQELDNSVQMALYQMGISHRWPQFKDIELKQIFLKPDVAMTTVMPPEKIDEIRYGVFQTIRDIERAVKDDNFPPHESQLCNWCLYYELCPAKRHGLALKKETIEEFDPQLGEKLAARYLEIDLQIKKLDSEKNVLRQEIADLCEKTELTRLETGKGSLKVSVSDVEKFPGVSDDRDAYLDLADIARQNKLAECFKFDPAILYKEFYSKDRLPAEVKDKLKEYLRTRKSITLRTSYKGMDREE